MLRAVEPVASFRPGRGGNQANSLIVADGFDVNACPLRELPNSEFLVPFAHEKMLLEPVATTGFIILRTRIIVNFSRCLFSFYQEDAMSELQSVITCPHCAYQEIATMPTDACQVVYVCNGCSAMLRPKPGDCCVFCSYG